jgi:hypothetical protein
VAAPLRLPHHGEGGVLVDLEKLERVGDEQQVHGKSVKFACTVAQKP